MPLSSRTEQLNQWREELRSQHTRIESLVHSLSHEAFHHKPGKDDWSIAQQLDHLRSSNSKIAPKLLRELEAAPETKASEALWKPNFFERQFLKMVGDNPPMPVPVPPMYVPSDNPDAEAIVAGSYEALQLFEQVLDLSPKRDIQKVKVTSPAAKWMKMTVGCWVQGTVIHNNYHLGCAEKLSRAVS